MSDLKIRGGGTILGASQSGHIAAVGYDMFLKLMESSIAELKGEATVESLEPEINVNFSALLAELYIPDIDQRMSAYRRLAKMTDLQQISDFKSELIDRFGSLPDAAGHLVAQGIAEHAGQRLGPVRFELSENAADVTCQRGVALDFHAGTRQPPNWNESALSSKNWPRPSRQSSRPKRP